MGMHAAVAVCLGCIIYQEWGVFVWSVCGLVSKQLCVAWHAFALSAQLSANRLRWYWSKQGWSNRTAWHYSTTMNTVFLPLCLSLFHTDTHTHTHTHAHTINGDSFCTDSCYKQKLQKISPLLFSKNVNGIGWSLYVLPKNVALSVVTLLFVTTKMRTKLLLWCPNPQTAIKEGLVSTMLYSAAILRYDSVGLTWVT